MERPTGNLHVPNFPTQLYTQRIQQCPSLYVCQLWIPSRYITSRSLDSHIVGGPNYAITQLNCLTAMYSCQASAVNNYQCIINIPTCQTVKGTYFVSVYGLSQTMGSNYSVSVTQQRRKFLGIFIDYYFRSWTCHCVADECTYCI
jgi:hypothetical protein